MSDEQRQGSGIRDQGSGPGSRLGGRDGWWRTLEEQADDPAFQEHLYNEFPSQIEAIPDPVARRTFLRLMGASLALAGATACTRQPPEKIVPYVRQPEELIPGRPLFYATAMPLGGVATGLLVESHEGRPTRIEGNPLHPGSLGASDVFARAAILGLYDPDRAQTLTHVGDIRPWSAFLGAMRAAMVAQQPLEGAGLRILTESIASPTLPRRFAICSHASLRRGGSSGIRRAATTPAPAPGSPSGSTSTLSTISIRPTSSSRSTPISSAAAPDRCATRAILRRAAVPNGPIA
jgi:molybdopterin-containing oxidoreductase family iron-sulfur binding subunit